MAAVRRLAGHAELDPGPAGVAGSGPYAAVRTGEVHAIALDATEAREDFGWKPSIKLVDGIQCTIHGYAALGNRAARYCRCLKRPS